MPSTALELKVAKVKSCGPFAAHRARKPWKPVLQKTFDTQRGLPAQAGPKKTLSALK